jgi:hypothetical protein
MPITAAQLQSHLFVADGLIVKKPITLSTVYRLPDEDYFYGEFSRAFDRNTASLGLTGYVKNRRDCNKYALFAKVLADICHDRAPSAGETDMAVGVLGYIPDSEAGKPTPEGHLIVLGVCEINGALFTRYLEVTPPPARRATLTDTDKMRGDFYLI